VGLFLLGSTHPLSVINHTKSVSINKLGNVVSLVTRLNDFVREGSGQCKCELMQLLYPTFVNIYLDLIARGVSAVGKVFYLKTIFILV